jgi:hypothetical protein
MSLFKRNTRNARVTIHVPGITSMPGLVVASVEGASEVALPKKHDVESRFLHRQPALLTFSDGEQVSGTLLAYESEDGGLREDRMQLLHNVFGAPPRPVRESVEDQIIERAAVPLSLLDEERAEQLAEEPHHLHYVRDHLPGSKRRGVRVQLIRPVAIVPESFKIGWLNGATRNVSVGGILVSGAEQLQSGDGLRLRFELDHEDDVIDIKGRVVRDNDPWGLRGVRIESAGERERERLIRYIYESQRRAIARRTLAANHAVPR